MRPWAIAPVLLAAWLLLWGDASIGNLLGGVIVVTALLLVFRLPRRPTKHRLAPVGAGLLLLRFLGDLVMSSVRIIVTVLFPTDERLRSGIVKVDLTSDSSLVAKAVSDLICLTPGTLTVEVEADPTVLYVHVLGLRDPEELRQDVLALERRVLRALPVADREESA